MALAGIGKVNAAAAATLLLAVFGARVLIFAGVAGGLNPAFPVGSVLLAFFGRLTGRQRRSGRRRNARRHRRHQRVEQQ